MQLRALFMSTCCLLATTAFAQEEQEKPSVNLDDVEITFLTSYYMQDGNHSPVTGGEGTEKLTNIAPSLILNIPIDTVHSLSLSGGVDYYSSASSDNINNPYLSENHVSSASANDTRTYFTLGYKNKHSKSNTTTGVSIGGSIEHDVASIQVGASFEKSSKDHNRAISMKASYYYDDWSLIYPVELRNGEQQHLSTNTRHTANLSTTGSFVLSKKMQVAATLDVVYQHGLLSTPFHRIYFQDYAGVRVEQLPGYRFKLPVGLRLNYSITDWLKLRSHYRFYWDSWAMIGNTIKVEFPIKIADVVRLYPFYRFHHQTGTKYFKKHGQHISTDEFYTSDYDLSELTSHKYGLGISITPVFGIFRWKGPFRKKKVNMLKSIDLRYARYNRSDGLNANVWTVGINFTIDR